MHACFQDVMFSSRACMLSTLGLPGLMYILFVLQDVCLVSATPGQLENTKYTSL